MSVLVFSEKQMYIAYFKTKLQDQERKFFRSWTLIKLPIRNWAVNH